MPRILTINPSNFSAFGRGTNRGREKKLPSGRILSLSGTRAERKKISFNQGGAKIGIMGAVLVLAVVLAISGAFYLYQVNDLAGKSYEIRDVENQIQKLKKANEENQIKEVELKSMYNIEKNTEDLNMVSPQQVSYLQENGPVAMK